MLVWNGLEGLKRPVLNFSDTARDLLQPHPNVLAVFGLQHNSPHLGCEGKTLFALAARVTIHLHT